MPKDQGSVRQTQVIMFIDNTNKKKVAPTTSQKRSEKNDKEW